MKSFKDWPILWKLLAIGVGTILVCNALWYLGEGYFVGSSDQAQEIRSAANRVSIEMLEARRAEKDFLLHDLEEGEFYQRGDSVHLQKQRKALAALLREVDTLSRFAADSDKSAHDELRTLVDKYAKAFAELVTAYRERGYFNWGLEG